MDFVKKGVVVDLIGVGVIIRIVFCGLCFGVGDMLINNGLSICYIMCNFLNCEGFKLVNGQMLVVVLMDVCFIAVIAVNGGYLIFVSEFDCWDNVLEYVFDVMLYKNCVYQGFVKGVIQ